jgi:hypothetical protein
VARGIPFAFGTGYGHTDMLPSRLAEIQIFSKPYRVEQVANGLRKMMALSTSPRGA